MKQRSRIYYTEPQKSLMWDRWQKGESLHSIARLFGRGHSSIQRILSETGGIRPPSRRRSGLALTLAEREEISRGLVGSQSVRSIAESLGRAPSTVSREIRRNGGRQHYRAGNADQSACVEDRAVPGHWEGDLIIGSHNSQIATLVERHTRYVMLVRVPGKDTKTVIDALIKHAHKLPRELYKSLTWDRGKEMANHQRFSLDTDIKVYFCDPGSPWQRGSNENTNGLLRQYFPKGMDLSKINQNRLNAVARQLNERPKKRWALKRQLIDLTHVLRRPIESKGESDIIGPERNSGWKRSLSPRSRHCRQCN